MLEEEPLSMSEEEEEHNPDEASDQESDNDDHNEQPETVTRTRAASRAENRPKRKVKPVIRLTYDEPGRAKDQPLTIEHRGVVIKIGKSF